MVHAIKCFVGLISIYSEKIRPIIDYLNQGNAASEWQSPI